MAATENIEEKKRGWCMAASLYMSQVTPSSADTRRSGVQTTTGKHYAPVDCLTDMGRLRLGRTRPGLEFRLEEASALALLPTVERCGGINRFSIGTSISDCMEGSVGESSGRAGSMHSVKLGEGEVRLTTRLVRRRVVVGATGKVCLTNTESSARGVLSYSRVSVSTLVSAGLCLKRSVPTTCLWYMYVVEDRLLGFRGKTRPTHLIFPPIPTVLESHTQRFPLIPQHTSDLDWLILVHVLDDG